MTETTDTTELLVPETMHIDPDHSESNDHRDQNGEHQERPRSVRDEMMESIARRREEAIERELRQGEDFADEARRAAGLEALPHNHGEDVAQHTPEPAQSAPEAPKQPVVRFIEIDGEQYPVTEDQLAQLAAVGARANMAVSQHQHQQRQAPQPQQQPQQQAPQPRRSVVSKEDAEAVADRLLYGGKDQVAATLQAYADHIVSQTQRLHPQINPDHIAAQAKQQALQEMQQHNDLTTLSGEYPELFQDRVLGELAAVQLTHLRREDEMTNTRRTNLDSYREACNRVLDKLGKPRPGVSAPSATQAAPSAPSNDRSRVERKRAAPTQPTGIDRRITAASASRAKSGAEIVEMMRKSRGQMSMS